MEIQSQILLPNLPIKIPVTLTNMAKRILAMLAFDPIQNNAIAIGLGIGMLVLLNHPALIPQLGKYHPFFIYALEGLILIQTLKSATRSLFIPAVSILAAGIGFVVLHVNPELTSWLDVSYLQQLMLLGIIGTGMSIFVIR